VAGRKAKPSFRVTVGVAVSIDIPPPTPATLAAEDIPIEIIHEDDDLLVVNKPPGLVVHPAAGHFTGTLVNALLHHCHNLKGIGGEQRPGIVHRLDKDTSGALVVAKTDRAMMRLTAQFRRRTVSKEYVAIVRGCPEPAEQRIETLIGRNQHDRKRMTARPTGRGRTAITLLRVVRQIGGFSLVRLRIETGRTHQIRVHMAHIGHPVAGDRQYGGRRERTDPNRFPRQMLHAETLSFTHPTTGLAVSFKAPLPQDFLSVLKELEVQTK
jgi:23S rRNA pseudouridine1911/1915/1917 synthase